MLSLLFSFNKSKTFSPQAYHHVPDISHIQKKQSDLRVLGWEVVNYSFYVLGRELSDTILVAPKSDPVQLSYI